ncbi:regulatory protein RecX [Gluconacetobacter entanii]|uniref:Regulatory protein RecX n=1 Tax=Gluconacetobacter entanii TaxID=108528 RepID=A0A318PTK5_9PROT|nr:RecX family transcriptional regulator [Gluconacetobacter entanii]MCE2578410.1 RecX family transcriptional regulator [Komagataeibacter sp. FNDCR1]PYD63294.1 recombinase A [Gluconacetobacter entanii]
MTDPDTPPDGTSPRRKSPRHARRDARGPRRPPPAGPAPDRAALRAAALAHVARFATTIAGMERMLGRVMQRWGRRVEAEGMEPSAVAAHIAAAAPDIAAVIADMRALGAVDDARFSESRARSLTRAGRSRRAVGAHLQARGVDGAVVAQVMEETLGARGEDAHETELAAALVFVRKRRAGPFARPDATAEEAATRDRRAMEAMARSGFSRDIAMRALEMDTQEAEERIWRMKSA